MALSIELDTTFGAYLLGTMVSMCLYGVSFTQCFYYYLTFNDPLIVKLTVALLWILESLHAALSMHNAYHYLITNFLNPLALLVPIWSGSVNLGILGIIICVVQVSYARRIYHLNGKKKIIPVLIVILAIIHLGFSWAVVGTALRSRFFVDLYGIPMTMSDIALAMAAAIDITIAATLSYLLHRSRTGLQSTDRLVNRLLVYTVNNGILTSVGDVITLVFVLTKKETFYYFATAQVVGNLYTNSLMATLNSRKAKTDGHTTTVALTAIDFGSSGPVTESTVSNPHTKRTLNNSGGGLTTMHSGSTKTRGFKFEDV